MPGELVGVRYKDFIESADTIAAMGSAAKSIIDTAGELGILCDDLVVSSCDKKPFEHSSDMNSQARAVLEILTAPEKVSRLLSCST